MVRIVIGALCCLFGVAHAAAPVIVTPFQLVSQSSDSAPADVTLKWALSGAASCTASGGWSGVKSAVGQETITGIMSSRNFILTCSGTTVEAVVNCTPPTQNTDGSALTDLAGYRVYSADTFDGAKQDQTPIDFPASTNGVLSVTGLNIGQEWFTVKAVNSAGTESFFSNVVGKSLAADTISQTVSVTLVSKPKAPVCGPVTQP